VIDLLQNIAIVILAVAIVMTNVAIRNLKRRLWEKRL